MGQVLGNLDQLLLLVISLALVVGSVGILNTMLMSTSERLAEFGILRTNGWSRGDVLRLVLVESVCLGLLAGLLGCLLAFAAVVAGESVSRRRDPAHHDRPPAALGLGLALVLGSLGGLYPAWRVPAWRPWRSSGSVRGEAGQPAEKRRSSVTCRRSWGRRVRAAA